MKVFYMDTETTGLDSKKNDIIQLGYIVEINNEIKEKGKINIQPFSYDNIETSALEVNKITIEEMKTFDTPQIAYIKITNFLGKYVNKYDKTDKFIPAGYNVKFDTDFLRELFIKNGDKYYGSYIDYHFIDGMALVFAKRYAGKLDLPNYKLETVAKHYGIEINAHDALSDIEATRELILKIMGEIEWKA